MPRKRKQVGRKEKVAEIKRGGIVQLPQYMTIVNILETVFVLSQIKANGKEKKHCSIDTGVVK